MTSKNIEPPWKRWLDRLLVLDVFLVLGGAIWLQGPSSLMGKASQRQCSSFNGYGIPSSPQRLGYSWQPR
jgi:hypothetical protein